MARAFTVDASVTVKLFLREAHSDKAEALFSLLADEPRATIYVPDLLYIECANILWKYTWRFGYDPQMARENLKDLSELALTAVTTEWLFQGAFELARQYQISAYDAVYVTLAESMGTNLVTADTRLAKKLQRTFPTIQFIGDFQVNS